MKRFRVAIAGSGPAGLAAAILLHRRGHQVQLFERFAEPRPVGSGLMLQPTGLAVLEALGLAAKARACGSPIERLSGECAITQRRVLDVRYSWLGADAPTGLGIHRASLFGVLADAAANEGISISADHEVTGSRLAAKGRLLQFKGRPDSEPFDLLIDAAGMRSPLSDPGRQLRFGALWATVDWPEESGFDDRALEQRYVRANVMVGLMPTGRLRGGRRLGTFFWSLKADERHSWDAEGLDQWKSRVRAVWPQLEPVLDQLRDTEQLTFAQYAHRTLPTPAAPHMFHIGDSWHSTSPQLGQGANMALLDAYALAAALDQEPDLPAALRRARGLRRRHVRLYQALSFVLTPFYQSESRILPAIRDLAVPHIAKHWPATWIQAAMLSGLMGNPLKRLGLEGPANPTHVTRARANV